MTKFQYSQEKFDFGSIHILKVCLQILNPRRAFGYLEMEFYWVVNK